MQSVPAKVQLDSHLTYFPRLPTLWAPQEVFRDSLTPRGLPRKQPCGAKHDRLSGQITDRERLQIQAQLFAPAGPFLCAVRSGAVTAGRGRLLPSAQILRGVIVPRRLVQQMVTMGQGNLRLLVAEALTVRYGESCRHLSSFCVCSLTVMGTGIDRLGGPNSRRQPFSHRASHIGWLFSWSALYDLPLNLSMVRIRTILHGGCAPHPGRHER